VLWGSSKYRVRSTGGSVYSSVTRLSPIVDSNQTAAFFLTTVTEGSKWLQDESVSITSSVYCVSPKYQISELQGARIGSSRSPSQVDHYISIESAHGGIADSAKTITMRYDFSRNDVTLLNTGEALELVPKHVYLVTVDQTGGITKFEAVGFMAESEVPELSIGLERIRKKQNRAEQGAARQSQPRSSLE